jgi:hypothetical protein
VDYPADAGLPPPVYPTPYAPGPYPAYDYPADPYYPHRPPGTNGKAVAALVSALAGLLCCGLSSVAGLILGIMGMRETRRTGQDGFGLALAGTIIGALVIVGWVLYWLVVVSLATSLEYSP